MIIMEAIFDASPETIATRIAALPKEEREERTLQLVAITVPDV